MKPLRIVVVMIEPPLPFGNAAARWFYVLLRGLVERGHRVTAFAACSKPGEIEEAARLFPQPDYDLRCYAFPARGGLGAKWATLRRPYSYMFSQELRRDLKAVLAGGFDILHLEQLWCGWLGLGYRDRALLNVHYLQAIDQETLTPASWGDRLRLALGRRAERQLLHDFSHFRALSKRLSNKVRAANPAARVEIVPLGLDPDLYPFISDTQRTQEPIISVIGNMAWYPSCSAAVRLLTRLWPEIRRQLPEARLRIVGWNARSALRNFLDTPGVTIEENVADMRPYFERTGVLLYAPERGSGMKVKVLEALALGVPVVTTAEGVEGLPAEDGIHASICDEDAGLIERTVRLLNDRDAQNRQRAAGRALLEKHCGPGPTLDGMEHIYRLMVNGKD